MPTWSTEKPCPLEKPCPFVLFCISNKERVFRLVHQVVCKKCGKATLYFNVYKLCQQHGIKVDCPYYRTVHRDCEQCLFEVLIPRCEEP